jgi:hypothetical protein
MTTGSFFSSFLGGFFSSAGLGLFAGFAGGSGLPAGFAGCGLQRMELESYWIKVAASFFSPTTAVIEPALTRSARLFSIGSSSVSFAAPFEGEGLTAPPFFGSAFSTGFLASSIVVLGTAVWGRVSAAGFSEAIAPTG